MTMTSSYLDRAILEEVKQTVTVCRVCDADGRTVSWRVMVLRDSYGRQRWTRLKETARREIAVSYAHDYIVKSTRALMIEAFGNYTAKHN